jgi:cell division protein FtsB
MIYVKVKQMNKIDELEKEIENLEVLKKKAKRENALLKDEVDSLWAMMDEITKSDIENFSHILDEIKADVITRALMVSKKKVDC